MNQVPRVAVVLLTGVLTVGSPTRAATAQPGAGATVSLRSGIVVDLERGAAYVMRVGGGVAAIDLASGRELWVTEAADKPIALIGDRLLGQVEPRDAASRLDVTVLQVSERGALVGRGALPLPAGVRSTVGETLAGTFDATARRVDDDAVLLWEFAPAAVRGMPGGRLTDTGILGARPPQAPGAARGAARVDLSDGTLSVVDTLGLLGDPIRRLTVTDPTLVPAAPPNQFLSVDGRHVLVSEQIGDEPEWLQYRWTIYERGTGRPVGAIATHLSFSPFIVYDSLVVFETTPYVRAEATPEVAKMRGVSLASGEEIWSAEVREVVYRGPTPP